MLKYRFGIEGRLFGFLPVKWTVISESEETVPVTVKAYLAAYDGRAVAFGLKVFARYE